MKWKLSDYSSSRTSQHRVQQTDKERVFFYIIIFFIRITLNYFISELFFTVVRTQGKDFISSGPENVKELAVEGVVDAAS